MTAKPKRNLFAVVFIIAAATLFLASAAPADVLLYDGKPYLHVIHEGRSIKIQRIQDPGYELKGYFAKTARKCPPFCIQPIAVDPAVRTIGEIELFHFMENDLREGRGVLIDARTPSWHKKGTIPGSVNYPFTLFTQDENADERDALFREFGAKPRQQPGLIEKTMQGLGLSDKQYLTDRWDFTGASTLVLWCNGPACGQSPRAIEGLISAGYPADKIFYYRGGMQMWQLWGLTTVVPES
jgi:rhodanese-related sulfurtransferase